MKKKTFALWLGLLSIALLAASCSGTPEYANAIPDDAAVVARFDVVQIAEKSGTGGSQELKDMALRLVRKADLSRSAADKIEAVLKNPAEAGLDLREPVLFFAADSYENHAALVGAVHSRDKLTDLLNTMAKEADCERVKEKQELSYAAFNECFIAYDDDWFFITGINYDQEPEDVLSNVRRRFDAKEESSIRENEAFKEMCKSKADCQVLLLGKGIEQIRHISRELDAIEQQLPAGVKLRDFAGLAELTCENGEAVLTGRSIGLTDEAKAFMEQNAKAQGKVAGKELACLPASAVLAGATNLNGKEMLKLLKKQDAFKDLAAEKGALLYDTFEALNGDLTFGLNDVSERGVPDMTLYAHVTGGKFLAAWMEEPVENGYAIETDKDQYQMPLGNDTYLYVGIKDGIFYCSTQESASQMEKAAAPVDAADFKGKITLVRLYVDNLLNLPLLKAREEFSSETRQVLAVLRKLDTVELSSDNPYEMQLRLTLKDKKSNVLQQLSETLADIAKDYANL